MTTCPLGPAPAHLPAEQVADLYRDHAPALFRLGMRLTRGDRYWAEDLVQEAMLRAWSHPGALSGGERPTRPWLHTVVRNLFIDSLRVRGARPREVAGDEILELLSAPAGPGSPGGPEDGSEGREVGDALRALTSSHRAVLVEVYYRDRTVTEAAQRLGIPVGTVKSRLHYAREALRAALAAAAPQPEPGHRC